jgi:hypothetical protein
MKASWGPHAPAVLEVHPKNCLILAGRCISPSPKHHEREHPLPLQQPPTKGRTA